MIPDVIAVIHAATGEPEELEQLLDTVEAEALRGLVQDLAARLAPVAIASGPDWICAEASRQAAHVFGVSAASLRTKDRHRPVSDARAVAQAVARDLGLTLTVVAGHFGQDHTSVMHSQKKVAASPRLQVAASRISAQIAETLAYQEVAS